jgi:hypothetical protein
MSSPALQRPGHTDLVDHLGQLTRPCFTHMGHGTGIGSQHGLDQGKGLRITATHDGEHTIDRAQVASGDGRIDEGQPSFVRHCSQLARHGG